MSRRAVLWVAFAVVHVGVAVLGFLLPNGPMGDVYLVYEPWSGCTLFADAAHCSLSDGTWQIPGLTEPWVYPQLALIPMLAAWAFAWVGGYIAAWAVLVTLVDAIVFAMLVGRGRSQGRTVAAWFWLSFIALLGPVGMYRLDGITVPIAIAGSLWLVGRPWLGSALLAVATWMKVWPAALIAAAFVAVRRRMAVLGGALIVTGVTVGVVFAFGGGRSILGFIADQTGRGLQIEAPVSSLYMWMASAYAPGAWVYYDPDMLTFQVTGPNVDPVIAIMTPLQVLAVAAVAVLGAIKAWRGASFSRLFPRLALGLVLAFIVFNKVGSPQYVTWIAAPLVIGLVLDRSHWWRPATFGLAIALCTQAVYPIMYGDLMRTNPYPFATILLTAKNVLLIALFVWVVVMIARVAPHPHVHQRLQARRRPAVLESVD